MNFIDFADFLRSNPNRIIISNPVKKTQGYRKVILTRQALGFLCEKHAPGRIEHENLPLSENRLAEYLNDLSGTFRQFEAWTPDRILTLKCSKKGKTTAFERRISATGEENPTRDREKKYILPEGTVIPPLVDLGVFTPEGKIAAPMRHKYRQINRFLEMVADVIPEGTKTLHAVDYACGRSYLTFVVYYYLTALRGITVNMTGVDVKANVVEECNNAAARYGYDGLRFVQEDMAAYDCTGADLVISLHACDTATDQVLYNAVRGGARIILASPCCQHELNAQMRGEIWPILTRYGIVKERTAALMTDALRANWLAAAGYRTQLMEFVELSHTPKNLLIRAVKTDMPKEVREAYRAEADALCEAFGFTPALWRLS